MLLYHRKTELLGQSIFSKLVVASIIFLAAYPLGVGLDLAAQQRLSDFTLNLAQQGNIEFAYRQIQFATRSLVGLALSAPVFMALAFYNVSGYERKILLVLTASTYSVLISLLAGFAIVDFARDIPWLVENRLAFQLGAIAASPIVLGLLFSASLFVSFENKRISIALLKFFFRRKSIFIYGGLASAAFFIQLFFGGLIMAAIAAGVLYASFLFLLISILLFFYKRFKKELDDYGPSVSRLTTIIVTLGPVAAILVAWLGQHWSQTGAKIPTQASLAALAFVIVAALAVGWRSFRRRDIDIAGTGTKGKATNFVGLVFRPGSAQRGASAQETGLRITGRSPRSRPRAARRPAAKRSRAPAAPGQVALEFLRTGIFLVDFIFVRLLAVGFGAALPGRSLRYGALLAWVGAAAALQFTPWLWAQFAGFALTAIVGLSLLRRWSWSEADHESYFASKGDEVTRETGVRVGFAQDLADEVIAAFLLLFLFIIPLFLHRSNETLQLFENAAGDTNNLMNWFIFVGGELARGLPLVDWSEAYGVDNNQTFTSTGPAGNHTLFALRVATDILLITTLVQGFNIIRRRNRQMAQLLDPSRPNSILDPFEEREIFAQAYSNLSIVRELQFYDDYRLTFLVSRPVDRAGALGAGRVAGYAFSSKALFRALYPGQLGRPGDPQGAVLPVVRESLAVGVRDRINVLEAGAAISPLNQEILNSAKIVASALATPAHHFERNKKRLRETGEALKRLELVRELEITAHELAYGAPIIASEARQRLRNMQGEKKSYLAALIHLPDEKVALAAARSLRKVRWTKTASPRIEAEIAAYWTAPSSADVVSALIALIIEKRLWPLLTPLADVVRHKQRPIALSAIQALKDADAGEVPENVIQSLRLVRDERSVINLLRGGDRAYEARLTLQVLRPDDSPQHWLLDHEYERVISKSD